MTESTPTGDLQPTTLKAAQKSSGSAIKKTPIERRNETERMHEVLMLLDQLFRREEAVLKLILSCLYDVGSVNFVNQKVNHRTANRLAKWIAGLSKPIFGIVALRWFYKNCPQLIVDWLYSKLRFEPTSRKSNSPTPAAIASEVVASELGTSTIDASDIAAPAPAPSAVPAADTTDPTALNATDPPGANPPTLDGPPPDVLYPATGLPPSPTTLSATLPSMVPIARSAETQLTSAAELDGAMRELVQLRSRVRMLTVMLLGVTLTLGSGIVWLSANPPRNASPISNSAATRIEEALDRTSP